MPNNFPVLIDDHLKLRQIIAADVENIFIGLSHPDIIKYYGVSYKTLKETEAQMKWFVDLEKEETGIWWAVVNTENTIFYGALGFNNLSKVNRKAEIGFWLLPQYWGKGIIKKAVEAACDYGFSNLNLHRIEALVESENHNSKRLLQKLNFNYEGTFVDCEIKNDNFISLDSYAKFR